MKILQVANAFPSGCPVESAWAAPGLLELHALHLSRALARKKHVSPVLVARADSSKPVGAIAEVERDGVRAVERTIHVDAADARASWIDPRADHDFAELVEREAPDVVHFHHLAGWGPRCIAVAREHGFKGWLTELCQDAIGIEYGCKHLSTFHRKYEEESDMIAAYNAGSARKTKGGMYVNQAYVNKVHQVLERLRKLK